MHQNGMGINHGRGRGYKSNPRSGPLITDHLQVQNLDRELQILRRKREVVQLEQQMLTMECNMDRKRQYEHTNRNINTYGNVWQPPPPKRLIVPQQPNPWMSSTHDSFRPSVSKSLPSNYIPSLLSKKYVPPTIPGKIGHLNARKDFRTPNVIKKKFKVPPNKLNTYPIKERKDLVLKATESKSAKNKANLHLEDSAAMFLRENQIPNNQVTGRLELALGSIVKEIRGSYSDNETLSKLISSSKHQRIMKQAVRERIRTVMLNKAVGSVIDIVKQYREKFPIASDKDIVELVINSEQSNVVNIVETDNPEEFFKKNINSILEKKVKEMASKLLKIYTKDRSKNVGNTKAAEYVNKKLDENDSILHNEMAMKVIRNLTGKYVTMEERNILTTYYTELIGDIVEKKLPEYLPQCTDQFLKIFNMDRRINAVALMATEQTKAEDGANKTEGKEDQEVINIETAEKEIEACDNNIITESVATEDASSKDTTTDDSKAKETTQIVSLQMDVEKSSTILKASNTNPIETLVKNTESHETIAQTTPSTKNCNSFETVQSATPLAKTIEETNSKSPITPVSTPMSKELPYYVKLIGRPKLPNRAVICDFLNKYRPNSIKKHKTINNLLVVGFINHDDYNKILTANETVIGDITIIIKASEKVMPGKENEVNDTTKNPQDGNTLQKEIRDGDNDEQEKKDANKTARETMDCVNAGQETKDEDKTEQETNDGNELIGKELDDQINDLLSTIKESENNDDSNKTQALDTLKEDGDAVKNVTTPEKVEKVSKVKETGRATPLRSSSRLGNVTPSTIRTRRASRLMQE